MLSLSEPLQISCQFASDEDSVTNRRKFPVYLLLSLLLLASCGKLHCHLPQNVAQRIGEGVNMSCASNDTDNPCQNILWTHYRTDSSVSTPICNGDKVSPLVSHYISIVDLNDGNCNLEIKTQKSAEGKYECFIPSTGIKASASLIILADYPEIVVETFSNNTGEYSNMTCSVEYFGDWAPTLEYITENEQNSPSINLSQSINSGQIVSANLVIPRNTYSSGYKCKLKFNEQGRKTKTTTTATNVPHYEWESQTYGIYGGAARRNGFNGCVVIVSLFLWLLSSVT